MVVTQSSSRYAGSNWGKCRCRSIAQRWHQSARDLDARRSSPRQYRAESQPHRAPPSRSQLSMGRMVAGRRRRECAACSMSQPPRTLTALVVLLHLEQAHRQSRSPSQRAGRAQRPPASVIYSVAPFSVSTGEFMETQWCVSRMLALRSGIVDTAAILLRSTLGAASGRGLSMLGAGAPIALDQPPEPPAPPPTSEDCPSPAARAADRCS
mmetsp:Transcript_17846/g.44341  ORF Transcript_17846/g.44341 Transcript_17846/m.44341 type:complete len:210 (-) Transcript_17846:600-1229(-)